MLLVLRAFAGGCTALTGIEAISNGVPTFRPPETRNAAATLVILALLLAALFVGVAALAAQIGAIPSEENSVISQLGEAVAGRGPLYYAVQLATSIILILAANTSFNGFPLLAAVMARDGYMPRQFVNRGDRLAYSNGIIVLGARGGGAGRRVPGQHPRADPPVRDRRVHLLHAQPGRHGPPLVAAARARAGVGSWRSTASAR